MHWGYGLALAASPSDCAALAQFLFTDNYETDHVMVLGHISKGADDDLMLTWINSPLSLRIGNSLCQHGAT